MNIASFYWLHTQVGGLGHADAFVVVKDGYIVQEKYWGKA